MKLIITDHADESVGLFPTKYAIESPFDDEHPDLDDLELFRRLILEIYDKFAQGKVTAFYDYKETENSLTQ